VIARAEVLVEATPEDAFRLFSDEIGLWWRRDGRYWNDPERAVSIRLEPGVGGRFLELYEDDESFQLGRVTAWEPGERLAVTWTQASWPDGVDTEVEVTFAPAGAATLVSVAHSGLDALGAAAVAGYGAGWEELLGWLAEHARSGRPA
jgi:uncharacterized protein YndB with AHSA1/START domain